MPVYKDTNSKTTDGRCWYFTISIKEGNKYKKYKSKMFKTKKEAENEEANYLVKIGKIKDANALTFNQIIAEYKDDKIKNLKPQSWLRSKVLCDYISEQLGDVAITNLSAEQYEPFRNWIDNHEWSICYKNKVNKQLKALINFAFKKHGIDNRLPYRYEPFKDVTAPIKTMEYFTYDEFKKFISVVDDVRFKALFLSLYLEGMRIGEANALQWRNVNLTDSTLSINKSVSTKVKGKGTKYLITSPKTKKSIRTIPIQKDVLEALKTLHLYWEDYSGFTEDWYIFGGENPIPETTITKAKNKYCSLAKVKEIRIHDFRHSCASYYIHLGATPSTLCALLGHASTKMTLDTYTHFFLSDLNKLIELANTNF